MTEEKKKQKDITYDVVVVGGGMAGICAAIAAARGGAHTALIHNRPVLGGNGSSEIRMHICGADCHGKRENARETGIIEEILLENRKRNPDHSFSIFDTVLWEKVKFQKNLDLYLNTQMTEVFSNGKEIQAVLAFQATTEKWFCFHGKIFVDCTGDAFLAVNAGAKTRMGRESRYEFGESRALEHADSGTMGNTLMFCARDAGEKREFERPFWAYELDENDLKGRGHSRIEDKLGTYGVDSGYWWLELGGTENVITDGEEIRDELLKYLYGIWDHIKNKGDHGADNYELEWVQFLPGKRESRRIEGDYILRQQDLEKAVPFDDVAAYGGWPMDMHPPGGFLHDGNATEYLHLKQVYGIPYRCYYSKDISNLMMAGRNISVTHMAFGSVRVMATCAVGGQAVGTAAAMAVEYHCTPREIGGRIKELQQKLLKDDCYLPGIKNEDSGDAARNARVTASSWEEDWRPENVINGISRTVGVEKNGWKAALSADTKPWLKLRFTPVKVDSILLKFDSDLSHEIMISLSQETRKSQKPGIPESLVKDYEIRLLLQGKEVYREEIKGNYQRLRLHRVQKDICADELIIYVNETNGFPEAVIYEVRVCRLEG